jgi:hypothetical protein
MMKTCQKIGKSGKDQHQPEQDERRGGGLMLARRICVLPEPARQPEMPNRVPQCPRRAYLPGEPMLPAFATQRRIE